jgi:hypothetical protein
MGTVMTVVDYIAATILIAALVYAVVLALQRGKV